MLWLGAVHRERRGPVPRQQRGHFEARLPPQTMRAPPGWAPSPAWPAARQNGRALQVLLKHDCGNPLSWRTPICRLAPSLSQIIDGTPLSTAKQPPREVKALSSTLAPALSHSFTPVDGLPLVSRTFHRTHSLYSDHLLPPFSLASCSTGNMRSFAEPRFI